MKNNKTIDDKIALKAFISPEIFPFLLEAYEESGKTEKNLTEDIKNAKESYRSLLKLEKKKYSLN